VKQIDPELASVMAAWRLLSPVIRAGILAMIQTTRKAEN
jgi:hypothetical protein